MLCVSAFFLWRRCRCGRGCGRSRWWRGVKALDLFLERIEAFLCAAEHAQGDDLQDHECEDEKKEEARELFHGW